MKIQVIDFGPIELKWSDWTAWNDLLKDARSDNGVHVPNFYPGVYEVKYQDSDERLTIGKASDLRMRIKQGLVKGKTKHSSGGRIRANEKLSELVVRWAVTARPSAVEEELHRLYKAKFGKLPRHTAHT